MIQNIFNTKITKHENILQDVQTLIYLNQPSGIVTR